MFWYLKASTSRLAWIHTVNHRSAVVTIFLAEGIQLSSANVHQGMLLFLIALHRCKENHPKKRVGGTPGSSPGREVQKEADSIRATDTGRAVQTCVRTP